MERDPNAPEASNFSRVIVEIPGYWALTEEQRATVDQLMKERAKARDEQRRAGQKARSTPSDRSSGA